MDTFVKIFKVGLSWIKSLAFIKLSVNFPNDVRKGFFYDPHCIWLSILRFLHLYVYRASSGFNLGQFALKSHQLEVKVLYLIFDRFFGLN